MEMREHVVQRKIPVFQWSNRNTSRRLSFQPLKATRVSSNASKLDDSADNIVPSEVTKEDESARIAVSRKILSSKTIILTPTTGSRHNIIFDKLKVANKDGSKDDPSSIEANTPLKNESISSSGRGLSQILRTSIGPRAFLAPISSISLQDEPTPSIQKPPTLKIIKAESIFSTQKETSTVPGISRKAFLYFDHRSDAEIVSKHDFQVVEQGVALILRLVTFANGAVYEGEMLNEMLHGKGYYRHPSGYSIRGNFFENKIQGEGEYRWKSTTYQGQWANNAPHGHGKETVAGVYTYDGEFQFGIKNGKGKWTIEGKGWYDGEVKNNTFNGRGTFCWNDGKMYVGHWKDGQRHGKGKMVWPDGRVFEGNYVNNKKEGVGQFKWADGRAYYGPWRSGQQEGKGKYLTLFGEKYEAKWRKGEVQIGMPITELTSAKDRKKSNPINRVEVSPQHHS